MMPSKLKPQKNKFRFKEKKSTVFWPDAHQPEKDVFPFFIQKKNGSKITIEWEWMIKI